MFVRSGNYRESNATAGARAQIENLFLEMVEASWDRQSITEAMVPHFEFFLNYLGRKFFLPGAERQDVVQEALAGLTQAGMTFDHTRGASYFDYATMCMRNRVLAAVRKANRNKQKVLSDCVALESLHHDPITNLSPDRVVPGKLMMEEFLAWMNREMSDLESQSLGCWLEGTGVNELSRRWEIEPKKVENALFRARKKAKAYLEAHGVEAVAA